MPCVSSLTLIACAAVIFSLQGARAFPAVNNVNGIVANSDDPEIRQKLYTKMYSYMMHSHAYENFTLEDAKHHIDEVENWQAPKELQEKFPYYLSGYDKENRPVWVIEFGKYNIREQLEKGPEFAKNLTEYLFQGIHRAMKSMIAKDTPEKEVRNVILIGDCEGLDLTQATNVATVSYLLTLLRQYNDFISQILERGIFFNMNYVATVLFDSFRPILGGVFSKFELYSANEAKWKDALMKALPADVIPTWYGGNKGYKPVQVFG